MFFLCLLFNQFSKEKQLIIRNRKYFALQNKHTTLCAAECKRVYVKRLRF